MIIVLDSNQYINYLNKEVLLLDKLTLDDRFTIYINETITKEILNNIKELSKKDFYNFIHTNNLITFNEKLPFYLLQKYKKFGLKKGDIVIAAFCEFVKADYLITENRHFLKSKKFDKFEVISIKELVAKLK